MKRILKKLLASVIREVVKEEIRDLVSTQRELIKQNAIQQVSGNPCWVLFTQKDCKTGIKG